MWNQCIFCVLVLSGLAAPLGAQGWTLDAYAGRATYDPVASAVGVRNAGLVARYQSSRGDWLYGSAAVPLATGDPSWVAAGGGARPHFAGGWWRVGLRLAGHAFLYRDPVLNGTGAGATAHVLPFAAIRSGDLGLEVASGPVGTTRAFGQTAYSRTVHRSDVRLSLGRQLRLRVEGRHLSAEEDSYPYAGASVELNFAPGRLWGGGGRWFSDRLDDALEWRVGAALQIVESMEVWGTVRHEAADPLYWTASRQSWDVGVSWRLGQRSSRSSVPAPAVASAGRLAIRLPVSATAGTPSVAGDFNGWRPATMQRIGENWIAEFQVDPGVYRYAFVDSDGNWFVPENFPGRRADGMNGFVAVVAVP